MAYFVGIVFLLLALIWVARFMLSKWKQRKNIKILQGAKAKSKVYSRAMKKEGEHYLWGNQFLNDDQSSLHFLAVGSPGSGKSINIKLLMKSVVARMKEEGSGVRALAYDSKVDLLSCIKGMGLEDDEILITNPFDVRRIAWDMSKDIVTTSQAQDMATLLVPLEEGGKNSYFATNARGLLKGLITAFQQNAAGKWTLRDLIIASRDSVTIQTVLSSCRYTEHLNTIFRVGEASESVCSNLTSSLEVLSTIAGSWHRAETHFSIKDWLESQKMLVLGNSPTDRDPIKRINQLLFTSIAKVILGVEGEARSKHWFFLDELRELGVLDELANSMITGRSKGMSLCLGFQDIHGMYGEYGQERCKEIIGCASNYALLRINPTQIGTQEWASQVAGKLRWEEEKITTGESLTRDGTTSTTSTATETKTDSIYIPSYFNRNLPDIKESGMMKGLYYVAGELYIQPYPNHVLFSDAGSINRVPDPVETFKNIEPIEHRELLLEPWDEDDLKRLGLLEGGDDDLTGKDLDSDKQSPLDMLRRD